MYLQGSPFCVHRVFVFCIDNVVTFSTACRYTVHSTDVDVGYGPKDLWESYLAYIESVGADFAMQYEGADSPVNSGNFVILPTERSKKFMREWIGLTAESIEQGGNQKGLATLFSRHVFENCETIKACAEKRHGPEPRPALCRVWRPQWWPRPSGEPPWNYLCALSGEHTAPKLDPCHPQLLFVHPICTTSGRRNMQKINVIKQTGFWYMEEHPSSPGAGCTVVDQDNYLIPRCIPKKDAGSGFDSCKSRLAFSGHLW